VDIIPVTKTNSARSSLSRQFLLLSVVKNSGNLDK